MPLHINLAHAVWIFAFNLESWILSGCLWNVEPSTREIQSHKLEVKILNTHSHVCAQNFFLQRGEGSIIIIIIKFFNNYNNNNKIII